jgi:hypothetical protein
MNHDNLEFRAQSPMSERVQAPPNPHIIPPKLSIPPSTYTRPYYPQIAYSQYSASVILRLFASSHLEHIHSQTTRARNILHSSCLNYNRHTQPCEQKVFHIQYI